VSPSPLLTSLRTGSARPLLLPLLAVWVAVATLACGGPTIPAETEVLAPGVWHHAVHLIDGPLAIHVVEVHLPDAWQAGVRLRTARAADEAGLSRTSELASEALAAINGDFFYGTPSRSSGMQIRDGELIEEPRPRSAFAMTADGWPVAGVFELRAGLITKSGHVLRLAHLNREPRASDELTWYNRHSLADSVRAPVGFFLHGLDEAPSVVNDTVRARVMQVRRRVWPLMVGEAQWVVVGGADFAQTHTIAPGDTVQFYALLPPAQPALTEGIGGGPRIVRDGVPSIEHEAENLSASFATDRHPRTAIGFSRDERTLFLVTVDGRQPGHSVGMSLEELADLMSSQLGLFTVTRSNAHQAINLDGGGSTTMVVRRQVVNRPSDQTGERPVANALLIVGPGQA
jgi:exopolysaccharide biosynthesis protein